MDEQLIWMYFNGSQFIIDCMYGNLTQAMSEKRCATDVTDDWSGYITVEDMKKSISASVIDDKNLDYNCEIFVFQNKTHRKTYLTQMVPLLKYLKDGRSVWRLRLTKLKKENDLEFWRFKRLLKIDSNLEIIGLFVVFSSERYYLFFHMNDTIKYCNIDDVSH